MGAQGDLAGARKRVEKFPAELRARLANEPQNTTVLGQLAQIEALLGHKKEALVAAQQGRTIMPESLDPLSGRGPDLTRALGRAWNGDKAAAVGELKPVPPTGAHHDAH